MANFQLVFQSSNRWQCDGTRSENRVGDQDSGSQGRPVSSELQVPGEPGHCVQEDHTLGDFPRRFSFKIASIAPAEMSNTPP